MTTENTRQQIERFLRENHAYFSGLGGALHAEAIEDDPSCEEFYGMDLTVATDDHWSEWSYQTGDNSYSGGAYFLPHWAVVTYCGEETADDMIEDVLRQLDELVPELERVEP